DYTIAVTSDFLITDSLSMWDEHLDTIPEKESDEFNKSSVEDLVPNPSESEDFFDIESECDMPDCDDSQTTHFSTFSNPFFDDSTSSDDEVIHEISFKTYSNLLFDLDKEIISSHFNPINNEDLDSTPKNDRSDTDSYLFESSLNCDTLISSLKSDSLLAEFAGVLIFLESIPPGVDETNCDPEEDVQLVERLSYDNSSPRPTKEFEIISSQFNPINNEDLDSTPKNDRSDTDSYLLESSLNCETLISSLKSDSLLVEFAGDSDSHIEEIDLSFNPDDPMPPSIEDVDNDSEGDILSLERLLHDDPIPLSDTLDVDFSNVVRVFLPFFTYPPGPSHRCGNFKKFNTHRSYLSESPMENIPGNLKTLAKGFYPPSLNFLSFNWES
nr:hypothetical protein [Tanacetum cinerariifolium]